jgi:hypothetical protein
VDCLTTTEASAVITMVKQKKEDASKSFQGEPSA